jgi:hypothetical protein
VRIRPKPAPCVNTDVNAFKKCDSTVERVQIMMRAAPVPWPRVQVTARGRVLTHHRVPRVSRF